jgi:TonB family protein
MLKPLTLIIVLCLSLQGSPAIGQTKCKEKLGIGPWRSGPWSGPGTGPTIRLKPQPKYTKEALRRKVQGTVILRVVLHSSGKVTDVCVHKGLPYGLTRRAVEAAYNIVFDPAINEGRPVTVKMLMEYDFTLY